MAKLAAGLTILTLIFVSTLLASSWFSTEINNVEQLVYEASELTQKGDLNGALDTLIEAKNIWEKTECVALVFIHSSKSESVNNAFFEYLNTLASGEEETAWLKERLIYHLRSAVESERLSIKTIL